MMLGAVDVKTLNGACVFSFSGGWDINWFVLECYQILQGVV